MLTNLKSFFTTLFFAWACMAGAETVPQYDLRDFDFSLVDPADFFFVVVSDTHVTPVSEPCERSEMVQPYVKYETWGLFNARFNNNKFALVIEQVNAMDPAFMVHLGDIVTSWPTTETYNDEARNANELMEALEVPYYLTPGNHDIGNKWQKDAVKVSGNFGKLNVSEENEKRYKGHFGDVFFSWDYQGRHFIVLNMEILNSPLEDNRLQMEWLRRDLEENKDAEQIYMFGHRTLYWNTPHDIGTNHYEVINEPARSEILDLVERYGVEAFYTGHTHHTIRNRYGSTQLITAPSTAFYRNTYMFYPALSGGNHDPAKCGYFIVRVYDDKAVTNLVRNIDVLPDVEPSQEGQPVRAKRVVTKQSVESEGALVMLDVPVPTSTRVQAGPSALNDGLVEPAADQPSRGAAWRSLEYKDTPETIWVQIELAEPVKIGKVALHGESVPAGLTVETSTDGETWQEAAAYAGPGFSESPQTLDFDFRPRMARHVRIAAPGKGEQGVGTVVLSEVEVFGKDGVNYALTGEGGRVTTSMHLGRSEGIVDDNIWTQAWDIPSAFVRITSSGMTGWEAVERRPGVFKPSWLVERALSNSKGENVRYVMPLTLRHSAYAPGDTEAFSAYCRAMAEHFGDHIAMWDLPRCTKDPVTGYVEDYVCPADEYIAKFNAMREAISAVQPGAKFAATGLLLSNPRDLDAILQAIGGEADLIGVMPASQNLLGVVHFGQRPSLGQLGPALDRLQEDFPEAQLCVEYRPAALADSPHVGAADIARTFIKLQNRGVITGLSMSQGYSLLDDFADPRQAFYALRLLATLYDGGLTPLDDAPVRVSDARVLQWTYETDKGALLAAWMPYYENRAVDLQLPAGTKSVVAYDPMTSTSQQLRVTNGAEGPVAEDVLMSHSPCVYLVDTGAESAR